MTQPVRTADFTSLLRRVEKDSDLLLRVLRVKLTTGPAPPAPVVALPELAAELVAEQASAAAGGGGPPDAGALAAAAEARWSDLGQRRSLVDRAMMSLLSAQSPDDPNGMAVADRLVACYGRGLEERRRLGGLKGEPPAGSLELCDYCLELSVSYCCMGLTNPQLFPQPPSATQQGPVQLLALLEADVGGGAALPSGFLVRLCEHAAAEGSLDELASPCLGALSGRMAGASVLAPSFVQPLRLLVALLEAKPMRAALVQDARFMPAASAAPLPPRYAALAAAMRAAGAPGVGSSGSRGPAGPPSGRAYEEGCLLGPFFRPSGFPPESMVDELAAGGGAQTVGAQLFAGAAKGSRALLESNLTVLRLASAQLATGTHAALQAILRAKEAQQPLFQWLAAAITANADRRKDWYAMGQPTDPQLASLGFVYNLAYCLLKLCEPFADQASPHAAKIDGTFLLSSHRFDCRGETKLLASEDALMHWLDPRNADLAERYRRHVQLQQEAEAAERAQQASTSAGGGASTSAAGPSGDADGGAGGSGASGGESEDALLVSPSFGTISEYFFLALRALNVSAVPASKRLAQLDQSAGRLHQELRRLRESGEDPAGLQQLEAKMDALTARRLCYEAHLADKDFCGAALRLYLLSMAYLLRLVAEGQGAQAGGPKAPDGSPAPAGMAGALPLPSLPLPRVAPRVYAAQPEHVMEDALQWLTYAGRYDADLLESLTAPQLQLLLTYCVTFLGEARYVNNPYLRARLCEVVVLFVPRKGKGGAPAYGSSRMADVLAGHYLARKHLAPYLLGLFVDVEFLGGHSGFYDKFSYRHHMAVILEHVWTVPEFRESVAEAATAANSERFVRFSNFILNDTIYCMDEALRTLREIREVEQQRKDAAGWAALTDEERADRLAKLASAENHAGYFMQLANEIVHMLHYLSTDSRLVDVFMRPELVQRLGAMLNYFTLRLVGPHCLELKVSDPDKVHFEPRALLVEIGEIYCHFAPRAEFAAAVVADQRSFRPELLRKAVVKVLRFGLREADLATFSQFAAQCQSLATEASQLEEELGEPPDDFLCAITCELMKEPVLLPSGVHADKGAILRHLLSDPTDPFNRAKLTAEMLVPAPHLLEQIQAWREERLAAARSKAAAGPSADAMAVDG